MPRGAADLAADQPARGTLRRRPLWLFVSAAWLAPALLAVLKEYARALAGGSAPDPRLVVFEGLDWLLYALLTPFVFLLARRFPLVRGALARRLPLHLAAHRVRDRAP